MGYARCSTAQQELQSQLDALEEAGCDPVFAEKISTRVKVRPEFVKGMDFARSIKMAVPHQRVIFTVHKMKRLGRSAAELLTIARTCATTTSSLNSSPAPFRGSSGPRSLPSTASSPRTSTAPNEPGRHQGFRPREPGRRGRRPLYVNRFTYSPGQALAPGRRPAAASCGGASSRSCGLPQVGDAGGPQRN
ncbi:recombinase family protein [Streptomyces iakyrus]|uniref:recombinase family protein n=1 Tax=Streptomyces iakyrus TaxID=68219 RepID=UPI00383BDAFF